MADRLFLEFLENLVARGDASGIDFDTDDLWIMLVSSVPSDANLDAWDFRDDVSNEVTGTGYTAGGMDLGTTTITKDATNNRVLIDAPDAVWVTSTITALGAIIYKKTGGAASTDPLIGFWDFGGSKSSSGGSFTVQFSSSPAAYISVTGG